VPRSSLLVRSKSKRGRFLFREDRKLIQMAAGSATLDEAAVTLRTSVETIGSATGSGWRLMLRG
jgi:hypothetical protein